MTSRCLAGRLIRRCGERHDAGATLIEVLVSMSVMAIVGAMFTTGVLQMHRSVTLQESVTTSQSQVNIAFQRLDKELRYAFGIRLPGAAAAPGNIPYVEYLTETVSGPRCTQLRLVGEVLQLRTWDPEATSTPAADWRPLVSGVTTATGPIPGVAPLQQTGPFAFWKADQVRGYQRLRVSLAVTAGRNWNEAKNQTAITFTALNTSLATDSAAVCPAPRPTT